ncbi:MAG: SCO family protein [Pseudomonadota bacterium]
MPLSRRLLAGAAGAVACAALAGYAVDLHLTAKAEAAAAALAEEVEEARLAAAQHPEMGASETGGGPPISAGLPFPVEIQAKFALTEHTGRDVTEASYDGKAMVIFFGYATCEAICSVALPRLGEAIDLMGADADRVAPLVITVDPGRDTVEAMGPALAKWHHSLIGLTGSEAALAAARDAFQVEAEKVFDDPEGNPVYAHGSFIYLVGQDGKVLTLLPPILGPERMAEIIRSYL